MSLFAYSEKVNTYWPEIDYKTNLSQIKSICLDRSVHICYDNAHHKYKGEAKESTYHLNFIVDMPQYGFEPKTHALTLQ